MSWNASARALLMVAIGSGAAAFSALADDGPPPLTAPAGGPAIEPAPEPLPAPASLPPAVPPPATPRDDRPVLALPGISTPRFRTPRLSLPTSTAPIPPPSLAPTSDGGLPPLEMPAAKPTTAGSTDLIPLPSERFRGRVIESTPLGDALPPLIAPTIPHTTARPRSTPLSLDELDPFAEKDAKDRDKSDKEKDKIDPKSPPPPPRRFGLFNRFAPRPTSTESDSAIKAEPRSDPAADAAIKRRVERQANAVVGDKTRSIDVRVIGRSITIEAHGVKFFQRRAVRRSLETMPGLSGYRSVVEVVD